MIQEGNDFALTELFNRYYGPLCGKAYKRIPFTPIVEEIVQDVFLNFWKKASSLDPEGNIKAYLYATLKNRILFELRTEANRNLFLNKLFQSTFERSEHDGLENMYAKEAEQQIHQLISTLSPQCKEAFTLSRFEMLSYKEISERMGISVNTVEKHVAKALKILREKLGECEGVTLIFIAGLLFCGIPGI